MPPSVALNGQVTMIQVIKCLKCQQVQKPCHVFLMVLYLYLCLCFRCFNCLLVGLVMSHPVEKRAAPPRTSLDPMLENFEIVLCCLFCSRFCPLLLIQLCGTAPARTCQCCQLGGGSWAGNPKQSSFTLKPGRHDIMVESDKGMCKLCSSIFGCSTVQSQTHIKALENYSASDW